MSTCNICFCGEIRKISTFLFFFLFLAEHRFAFHAKCLLLQGMGWGMNKNNILHC